MRTLRKLSAIILIIINCYSTKAADSHTKLGYPVEVVIENLNDNHPEKLQSTSTLSSKYKNALSSERSRQDVVNLYNDLYLTAFNPSINWSGKISGCNPGTTNSSYKAATLQMINYFRTMVELPNVSLDAELNAKAQEAALMMIAQGSLSHSPSTSWACYTADGAQAAGKSNLALGNHGPSAVIAYMRDSGSGNTAVGHRRWILYPRQVMMGTGSTDARNGFFRGSNALWVISSFGSRPANSQRISWPPEGYVPYQVVYPRWSLALNSSQERISVMPTFK